MLYTQTWASIPRLLNFRTCSIIDIYPSILARTCISPIPLDPRIPSNAYPSLDGIKYFRLAFPFPLIDHLIPFRDRPCYGPLGRLVIPDPSDQHFLNPPALRFSSLTTNVCTTSIQTIPLYLENIDQQDTYRQNVVPVYSRSSGLCESSFFSGVVGRVRGGMGRRGGEVRVRRERVATASVGR